MLTFKTAGESHGKGLMVIVDGLPANIEVDIDYINKKMARRQGGYGRGGRMKIEKDRVEVFSGIRNGKTIGSPVGLLVHNRDWKNWQQVMSPEPITSKKIDDEVIIKKDGKLKKIKKMVTRPRPGHADLTGALKYNQVDIRNILERASARETAARVAMGGLTDNLLKYFKIDIVSHVIQIGDIFCGPDASISDQINVEDIKDKTFNSPLGCYNQDQEEELINYIDSIKKEGDSLGGIVEIRTTRLPVGLGSHTQWDRKLDGLLTQAIMSIPAIKGVEIGPAFENSTKTGSRVHDEIFYKEDKGYYRNTNRAGGLEGGMTNGNPLIIRMAMKPIPTLYKPLKSVDIHSKEPFEASVERSDVTAVQAAGVVGEAMVSFILARALLEKFGEDSMEMIMKNYNGYKSTLY